MMIVEREVIGDAGNPGVHIRAAQLFRSDDLAGRRFDERRAAQEDRPLLLDDDRLVRHRRHVRAARGAGAHHHGDLRNPLRRHRRLVEEDPSEVVAIRKDVDLVRQVRAARIDQIDAGQPVLARNFLRPQVLLDRHRIVGAALHGRVVADDHAFAAADSADARDDPGRGDRAVVHLVRGELRELEERRPGIDQRADALARQELAARDVLRRGGLAAALLDASDHGTQVFDEPPPSRRGSSRTSRRADRACCR
jgi:hypothetical protein